MNHILPLGTRVHIHPMESCTCGHHDIDGVVMDTRENDGWHLIEFADGQRHSFYPSQFTALASPVPDDPRVAALVVAARAAVRDCIGHESTLWRLNTALAAFSEVQP